MSLPRSLTAVLLTGAALAGCSRSGDNTAVPPVASGSSAPSRATPSAGTIDPFTGEATAPGRPVLAVKVDNTRAAKPQLGLSKADIVYVEQVEGGLSRVMAVFSGHLPGQVGPVRSARISDLHVLAQFGRPAFAYSGVQGKMKPYVAQAPLVDVSPGRPGTGGAYTRGGPNPAPYNLRVAPSRLLASAKGVGAARDIGFRFGPAPAGGKPVHSFTARYPSASFAFTWSASAKRWLVSQDGKPDRAAEGGRLGAPTIVVQRARTTRSPFHDFLGNYTPLIQTTGTGTATVLRDGRSYPARWSRPSESTGTTFTTASGAPMTFATGQVWVVLVNDGKPTTP